MVYLILAGLVLVLIIAVNVANAEPMPQDMAAEDERLDAQEQAAYRPRALSDRMQAKVYPFPRRRA